MSAAGRKFMSQQPTVKIKRTLPTFRIPDPEAAGNGRTTSSLRNLRSDRFFTRLNTAKRDGKTEKSE